MRISILISLLAVCFLGKVEAQMDSDRPLYCTEEDRTIFERYLSEMYSHKEFPQEQLLIETARFFLGTPYVGATLEKEPEGLVVNLREMDCTTFVETVISLVRTLRCEQPSFDLFCQHLQQLRYRNGVIHDYTDRLHYTSDWIFENQRKGIVDDITKAIGGVPCPLNLSFMSTHPGSYLQLKDNPERVGVMAEKEKEINARSYYYIPETEIADSGWGMRNGDIVCFVTSIKGLDIAHLGFVYRDGNRLTFIHASSTAKKVIINEDPIDVYVSKVKNDTGVMIVRLLE